MNRDLTALQNDSFDLVVIGGGIFGACAAWDAALRGLSVAVIDRADFGSATSANSYKLVHGGIRYIQHGDLFRVRQSSAERRTFLRIAPHLTHPLPILVPTRGRGMKGRAALRVGMAIYDLLTLDKDRGIEDPARRIGPSRMLSREDVLDLFPGVHKAGLTGGALFADGQMYNPPRLVLAFLKSAVERGAAAANHVEATGFLQVGDRVSGVTARDTLSGQDFEIRGKVVLNAAGPYAETLLHTALDISLPQPGTYSRDACFIVPRRWIHPEIALAVQAQSSDPDAIVSRGARHLFIAPWRHYSLIGTWHKVHDGDPDRFTVTDEELDAFIQELNAGYPALELTVDDVSMWNAGLVPFGQNQDGSQNLRFGHRSKLVDHGRQHGLENLLTLIGVRFTTGRWEAEKAIDMVFDKLGYTPPTPQTASTVIVGGDIGKWDNFQATLRREHGDQFSDEVLDSLGHNYGSQVGEVLSVVAAQPDLARPVGHSNTIRAQVVFAAREEMAKTLGDVVFRRTDMATGEYPGTEGLRETAQILVREGVLDPGDVSEQIEGVRRRFRAGEIARVDARSSAS